MANIQHCSREIEGKTEPVGHVFEESNLEGHHWYVVLYWSMNQYLTARSILKGFILYTVI